MEDVEWSVLVRLGVLTSSHPHLKTIARTRGSGLDKRVTYKGPGGGGGDRWGAGAGVKLVLSKLKLDPRPAVRWPGASGAVSVDQRLASKSLCRNGYRPATLLASLLSLLSQQLPEEERRSWRFRPKI